MIIKNTFLIAIIAAFLFSSPNAWADRKPLTAAQVKKTFIGKTWRNPRGGIFLFKKNGTYTYFHGTFAGGPWNYQLEANGVLQGATTTYQFFKNPDGSYEYYHGRTGRYIRAYLN